MKDKLDILLKKKGLSATSLSRMLGIQPSGLSHILSGRNKPSFDLVVKILRTFPEINPDWLLLDSDVIFRSNDTHSLENPLFGDDEFNLQSSTPDEENQNIEISESNLEKKNDATHIFVRQKNGHKDVERIVVLYTDGTFDSYSR
jgi:transcriptional regulator with XRE-family HTH domain